ncbi:MAG: translocation/assembly module TamB domain-containing protein [Candidatus Sulfotelmatobacter sp.]
MQWKKAVGWTFIGIFMLLIVGGIGGYFYLQSTSFRSFALRTISEKVETATGGKTQIGRLDFQPSTLTAHLYNIVIRGTEPSDAPPLLKVDQLTVSLKIISVFRREISLSELVIQHPIVHMRVTRDGKNNLPQAAASQSKSNTDIFDLAVKHFALTSGEINYNDDKTPLSAELYDLETDVRFNALKTTYSGTISYNHGRLQYAQYVPLPHSFNTKFTATRTHFTLESAQMKVASSSITLRGDVNNYANPVAAGDYDVRIHTQDFASLSPDVKAAGDVVMTGKIRYQNQANQPFMKSIQVAGQLVSEGISAMTSNAKLDVRKLNGTYQLANGNLQAHQIELQTLGGVIRADLNMRNLDSTPSSQLRATLHSISLRAVQQAARQTQVKDIAISGSIDGTADASWTGSMNNLRARSDLTVRAAARSTTTGSRKNESETNTSANNVPVNGAIHAAFDGSHNTLTLRQSTLQIPSTTLTADGEIGDHSSLNIHVQADDLHQLEEVAAAFSPNNSALPPISGSANVNALVNGSTKNPRISGALNAQNLHVQGSEWKSAAFTISANPSQVVVSNGVLVSAKRGRATFDGTVALRNWSYLSSNPLHANLSVEQMSVTDLEHLANVHYPISGDLTANLSVKGTEDNPSGSGSATISKARAYDETLQDLTLKFQAANGTVASTLRVAAVAGSADTTLSFTPKTKAYKIKFDAPAIVLQKLHTLPEKNADIKGTLTASASGEGTLDNPQLTASVHLPKLEVGDRSIAGLKAEAQVANNQGTFTVDSEVAQATIRARANINLTGDYETTASIDTSSIPLEALLASFSNTVPQGFQGQTELHATLKGPLKDKTRVEAHITIPTLKANYQQLEIAAAAPIHADYVNSIVTVQPAEIRGTDTSLRVQGSIPFAGASVPSFTAQGEVDIGILRMFAPDVHSSGKVTLDIRASGTSSKPSVHGDVQLHDVAVVTPDAPVGVEKLNGTLQVSEDRVQINSMAGEVGGGQMSIGGSIVYRPSLQFNLAMQGTSVRLRYPQGLRSLLDANLTLAGNMQSSTLNGHVLIDSLSFTPDFDLASFSDQFSGNAATPVQPGFADTVNLAVQVQSKSNLSARSSQVSLEGAVNVRASGTLANPIVTGRTDLTAGELFYRNNRYQLQRGIITFTDPTRIDPNLDVSVTSQIEQYNVTITLRGPFDRLTSSYVSDPPLATADVINLIAFGKTTSESAASNSSQSTDSMIASDAIGSGVSSGVQKLAGLSSLQIDPLLGGDNQNPSARVALQQRVTKNFLFTFSTDVSQPGEEIVQGEYQINKRWSVSVTRDQLGGVSVDGRYHTKF